MENATHCYYCNHAGLTAKFSGITDHLQQSDNTWSFAECDHCKALILSPHPPADDLHKYYPSNYTYIQRTLVSRIEYWIHLRWLHKAQAKITLRLLGKRNGAGLKLLDVGCGSGLFLKACQTAGFDTEGMDMRGEAVDHVRNHLRIPAKKMDLSELSSTYPPQSFDVITMFHVLEHVLDPAALTEQCRHLLKPGGALVFAVPLSDSMQLMLLGGRTACIREAPRHVSVPTHESIHCLFKNIHFRPGKFRADSVLNCAATYGLSFMPSAATPHQHRHGFFTTLPRRALALIISYLLVPLVFCENYIFRRPVAGIFAGFKDT